MKETIKSIIEWHETTFPEVNIMWQIDKFHKETSEFVETNRTDIMELADMFIATCGVARFDIFAAACCFSICQKEFETAKSDDITIDSLEEAIDKKMEINRQRK